MAALESDCQGLLGPPTHLPQPHQMRGKQSLSVLETGTIMCLPPCCGIAMQTVLSGSLDQCHLAAAVVHLLSPPQQAFQKVGLVMALAS